MFLFMIRSDPITRHTLWTSGRAPVDPGIGYLLGYLLVWFFIDGSFVYVVTQLLFWQLNIIFNEMYVQMSNELRDRNIDK